MRPLQSRGDALRRMATRPRTALGLRGLGGMPLRPTEGLRAKSRMAGRPGLPVQRGLGFQAFAKALGRSARVPAVGMAAGAGGLAYIDQKIRAASDYTRNLTDQLGDWVRDGATRVQDMWESARSDWSWTGAGGGEAGSGPSMGSSNGSEGSGAGAAAAAAAAATATSVPTAVQAEDDEAKDAQMMVLTRKMIEIRNLLSQIQGHESFSSLPSIIVIGSQSSGKSSVLEAIVGHEFLPKGVNMVTRRPIELTLINSPEAAAAYGEFPGMRGLGKITDFAKIQKVLTDLNLAVPVEECVSDEPIQLNIYSRSVPDLTLIDLPGYIQIQSVGQPEHLRERINELCERYIQQPNIILAVCAADVDLANSPALRASRRVDPLGLRTIGVVTKMDLVPPEAGRDILSRNSIPLNHGYIGVICKHTSGGLFRASATSLSEAVTRRENQYFHEHEQFFSGSDVLVGTSQLKRKLLHVLERSMAQHLQATQNAVRLELDETAYQFKVEFDDRSITAESYLAQAADALKIRFKQVSAAYGKREVREMLKDALNEEVMNILAERYWLDPRVSGLSTDADARDYWARKLDLASSQLTKVGVGRLSTTLITNRLIASVETLTTEGPLARHPYAKERISDAARDILRTRFVATADQVENCIKPFKHEIEVSQDEWAESRTSAISLMRRELGMCRQAYEQLKTEIGTKRLAQAVQYLERTESAGEESIGFSQALLAKARRAQYLQTREDVLQLRLKALQSRACRNKDQSVQCPEVFLNVVANKLAQISVLFLNVELLSEFIYAFPREVDSRLLHRMTPDEIEQFAREDSRVREHLDLQRKKELLQVVLEKIDSLILLERENSALRDRSPDF